MDEPARTNWQGYIHTKIDSELVPRGKGEKNPGEGSEIDLKPCIYKESKRAQVLDGVPIEE